MINEILTSIKAQVQTTLGAEYSEMPFATDVEKNNFNNNHNRFGVLAGASLETASVTKYVTMSQSYEIVISKAYVDDGISDADKQQKSIDAQDLMYDIYKSLVNTKGGIPSLVINITDLDMADPEYLEEQKVVIIRASFNVLHRFTLI